MCAWSPIRQRRQWLLLIVLLGVAILTRLYHLREPLLDQNHGKQVFTANRARNIARSPERAVWKSFDFLDGRGERMTRVEEVPFYTGLLGASYFLLGEHEWLGRAWSILATLLGIVALHDWLRREFGDETGLIGAFLFTSSPLMIFYGRSVSPDACMLACMLACAAAYRRYLDSGGRAYWRAAAVFGLVGALFKYYALMIVIPLADMEYRRGGCRSWLTRQFLGLLTVMVLPIMLWIVGVFARYPNPTSRNPYFLLQAPQVLLSGRFFARLTLGLFVNDLGPVTGLLSAVGAWGATFARQPARALAGWTLMGSLFVFLCAPKFLDHDYYGLLVLPAAAGWGGIGWCYAGRAVSQNRCARAWRIAAILSLAMLLQSPWIMNAKYVREFHHWIVAGRLNQLCSPSGKVVVLGQTLGWPAVHYSGRLGWVEECRELPPDWRKTFGRYRDLGAELVGLYFDPSVPSLVRETYRPLLNSLPVIEHRCGPWFRHNLSCEYFILNLRGLDERGTSQFEPPNGGDPPRRIEPGR